MKVKVYYFAQLRELAEKECEEVELEKGATLEELREALVRIHPELSPLKKHMLFAIGKRLAQSGSVLEGGDEVRVYPPVSGG
ncbi:MoaD/ThiS family protein [Methermicoccus shengliensis]|uniref:MoaD/ThiS family protein n=1 Tax=Methermicoccus shengliensis TaxID=660064 RepID=A0A832RSP8_9EURY|nr:MoaD/ThiS family protein [Methermicoccus shengliensis]KUK05018.1 MAG: Molybdenum cofactor biosynthesis protein D/E [Euryarchaeota archaeon 55_53]KUK30228.1 MAG: Molybdenum cofactor biosynthesis protein D/E [Methanosarcinales archeaon 56_1174]MDI3487598.1 molybdopterin synthase sulfur carrier subunit [Methanosarcinales archaeon]MDN5294747.1 molybdopterin synthase sulfur carrier subunit [Methanosarcinales archaeon]HIH69460.1 MoaD/ThiS family protein [Methermicoccus shengliensis]